MFTLHDFILDTVMGMVGREPDYKVRQYALGWLDKGQLTTDDLTALDAAIQKQYNLPMAEILPAEPVA